MGRCSSKLIVAIVMRDPIEICNLEVSASCKGQERGGYGKSTEAQLLEVWQLSERTRVLYW